jgi:hypothetical protein
MRLSLKRAAHAVVSGAAYRKFGASRSFFARCGIPQTYPSSRSRIPQIHTGALRSHQRKWAENDGRSPSTALCSRPALRSLGPERSSGGTRGFISPVGTHLGVPQPPPPGVSMCRMSPLAKYWLHLPGKVALSSPTRAASQALPEAPSSPPCKP